MESPYLLRFPCLIPTFRSLFAAIPESVFDGRVRRDPDSVLELSAERGQNSVNRTLT